MSDLFYKSSEICSSIRSNKNYRKVLDYFREYSEKNFKNVYVLSKPLIAKHDEEENEYLEKLIILIPKFKPLVINFNINKTDDFKDYLDDFIIDIEHYSMKHKYRKILGRSRTWEHLIHSSLESLDDVDLDDLFSQIQIEDEEEKRKSELLVSLLVGSVNDTEKVGKDLPQTTLEKVKRKIVMFDGDQTRFIYEDPEGRLVRIQGLAGTGKTELLLHKIKELYLCDKDIKIALTCHNVILSESLKERIPNFFDFMQVSEQIKWNERLWCLRSWGSKANPNTGIYSLISDIYGTEFKRYSSGVDFEVLCKNALRELERLEDFEPFFDYIFIDEGQDFGNNFIELCLKITKEKVFLAGDVFQNIFESQSKNNLEAQTNYVLKKCYRTDPKTLMFAHGLGLGLFENQKVGWIQEEGWKQCGYELEKTRESEAEKWILRRDPISRFDDISLPETVFLRCIDITEKSNEIVRTIKKIKEENPEVTVDDIGVMFLGAPRYARKTLTELRLKIFSEFKWEINEGYDTKKPKKGKLFVSTQNHVKGLEFPFVICVVDKDIESLSRTERNSIYMMLTRSFLSSYLVVANQNPRVVRQLEKALVSVKDTNSLIINEIPKNKKEIEDINSYGLSLAKPKRSREEIVEEIFRELEIEGDQAQRVLEMMKASQRTETDKEIIHTEISKILEVLNL